jgi:RND family efflux transporter MFP subunit
MGLLGAPEAMNPDRQTLDELRIDRTSGRRSTSPIVWLLVLLLLAGAAAAVVWWMKRPKAPEVRTLVVQQPGSGNDRTALNGSGYVTARREATVSSKVTGKVVEVLIEEGMRVEGGQVLARIDSSNVEKSFQLAEAQAESARKALEETRANLEQAERELKRFTQLAESQVASRSELDRAEAEAKSLTARLARQQADVSVAEREVALWRQQLDDAIIRAPFSGIVTTKNAQPGEMISPISGGGTGFTRTGICTIVDMSSLEVEVEVNESYINRVQSGQPVEATLDSYPDWRIPAKVIAIIPTANRQNATVKVRVGFEKLDPRILPEMSVKVAFQASAPAANASAAPRNISIPKSAVREREGKQVVWVVRDGRAEKRTITVGATRGDQVEVAAGLSGGEKIVIEPAESLAEGRVTEAKR